MKFLELVKSQYNKGLVDFGGIQLSDDFDTTVVNSTTSAISPNLVHGRLDETKIKFTATALQTVANAWTEQSPGSIQMKIEFMTDAEKFELKIRGDNNANYSVLVDGKLTNVGVLNSNSGGPEQAKETNAIPVPSTASKILTSTIRSGAPRKMRHVEIFGFNFSFSALITGPNDTVTSVITNDERPFIYQIGDSYTFGTGAGFRTSDYGSSAAINDFMAFRKSLGFDGYAEGVGGSALGNTGSASPDMRIRNRLAKIAEKRKVDVVSIALAYNDASDILSAPQKQPLLQAALDRTIDAIMEVSPGSAIIGISCATPKGLEPKTQKVLDLTTEIYAKRGIPLIGISNYVTLLNSAFYTGTDNVHPNPVGHEYRGLAMAREALMAALEGRSLIPAIKPSGFTVTYIERIKFAVNVKTEVVQATSAQDAANLVKAREFYAPWPKIEILSVA